MKIKSYIVTQD